MLTSCREIIDESDVYIDVHKAIRRMAPAPKARAPKGHIVTEPELIVVNPSTDQLIDVSSEEPSTSNGKAPKNSSDTDSRSKSPFGASPKTTFLKRTTSGADGDNVNGNPHIHVRGNATDMREHLKHLGPSNLASRPKTTRYNTVKIKPAVGYKAGTGVSSETSRAQTTDSIAEQPYKDDPEPYRDDVPSPMYNDDHAPKGGEGEGLLKSAGRDAKDGVQAVQQGYGGTDHTSRSSSPNKSATSLPSNTDGQADSKLPKPASPTASKPSSPGTINDDHAKAAANRNPDASSRSAKNKSSEDTLSELRTHSPTPRKRKPARSGSITETTIDMGGIRKVVLETTSSSDDVDGESAPGGAGNGNAEATGAAMFVKRKEEEEGDGNGDGKEQVGEGTGEEMDKKKKKQRRKKRKGGKGGEASTSGAA